MDATQITVNVCSVKPGAIRRTIFEVSVGTYGSRLVDMRGAKPADEIARLIGLGVAADLDCCPPFAVEIHRRDGLPQ